MTDEYLELFTIISSLNVYLHIGKRYVHETLLKLTNFYVLCGKMVQCYSNVHFILISYSGKYYRHKEMNRLY